MSTPCLRPTARAQPPHRRFVLPSDKVRVSVRGGRVPSHAHGQESWIENETLRMPPSLTQVKPTTLCCTPSRSRARRSGALGSAAGDPVFLSFRTSCSPWLSARQFVSLAWLPVRHPRCRSPADRRLARRHRCIGTPEELNPSDLERARCAPRQWYALPWGTPFHLFGDATYFSQQRRAHKAGIAQLDNAISRMQQSELSSPALAPTRLQFELVGS